MGPRRRAFWYQTRSFDDASINIQYSEEERRRMGPKGTASRRVEPPMAHLQRCRPSLYHPSDTLSGLRLASEPLVAQRGTQLILLEALICESLYWPTKANLKLFPPVTISLRALKRTIPNSMRLVWKILLHDLFWINSRLIWWSFSGVTARFLKPHDIWRIFRPLFWALISENLAILPLFPSINSSNIYR